MKTENNDQPYLAPHQDKFTYKDKDHAVIVVGSKVKDLDEGLPWVIKLLADCQAIDTTALPQWVSDKIEVLDFKNGKNKTAQEKPIDSSLILTKG